MHPQQTVSEMVEEVLRRQATALVDQTGEPFKWAMMATSKTEAAQQLRELAGGEYREHKAAEWQANLPWVRAEERHYSWLESYIDWLRGKEMRTEYHTLLEELASLRG